MSLLQTTDDSPLRTAAQVTADFIALSDERDLWQQRLLNNWRGGYAAAERVHADDYERGFAAGRMVAKRLQHEVVESTRLQPGVVAEFLASDNGMPVDV